MVTRQSLLGMFQQNPDQFQTLLGQYYDPKQAKMQWLGGTLQGLGAGLASGEPGAWAQGAIAGGGQGVDDYKRQALIGYKTGQDQENQAYARSQDEQNNAWRQQQWDYKVGQDKLDNQHWNQSFGLQQQRLADAQNGGGMPNIGLTPIPLINKTTGEYGVGQLSDGGLVLNGKPVNGSEWQPYDPYSLNAQKAAGTTTGKGQGTAQVDFNSLNSKMPGLENVVTQLDDLAGKATYTLAGQVVNAGRTQLGMDPSEGAVARTKYQSLVANQILPLLRDTFGAQFTAREGDTLMATLGDPNKTPPEKQAVLKSFIEQKRRDVEALAAQAGQPASAPQQGGARLRFNPATGELE